MWCFHPCLCCPLNQLLADILVTNQALGTRAYESSRTDNQSTGAPISGAGGLTIAGGAGEEGLSADHQLLCQIGNCLQLDTVRSIVHIALHCFNVPRSLGEAMQGAISLLLRRVVAPFCYCIFMRGHQPMSVWDSPDVYIPMRMAYVLVQVYWPDFDSVLNPVFFYCVLFACTAVRSFSCAAARFFSSGYSAGAMGCCG